MNLNLITKSILVSLSLVTVISPASSQSKMAKPTGPQGLAATFPWVFEKGNETSKTFALTLLDEIANRADHSAVSMTESKEAWKANRLPRPSLGHLPSKATLHTFGVAVHASKVLYGSIAWHTRSIWVNAGPKTISTATVNAYVYDVKSNSVTYNRKSIEGRSDEQSLTLKMAADIFLTPLVTAVSGGPATPQEQRAVQVALGKAYGPWVRSSRAKSN